MNRFRKTLTNAKLIEEFRDYIIEEDRYGHMQRFGQRMVNKYLLDGFFAEELFHEKDNDVVFEAIYNEILPESLKRQALS